MFEILKANGVSVALQFLAFGGFYCGLDFWQQKKWVKSLICYAAALMFLYFGQPTPVVVYVEPPKLGA